MPINLGKVEREAPALVSLAKEAAIALEERGLGDAAAAVYLLLDHSLSMQSHYRSGAVQRLAEQALALAVHLDDDGVVPVTFFAGHVGTPHDVSLASYEGVIERLHTQEMWGSTNLASALRAVADRHQMSGAQVPALLIVQTDGDPDSRMRAERVLADIAGLPVFVAFVGFGDQVRWLQTLGAAQQRGGLGGVSVLHARDPLSMPDGELYDGLLAEYPAWLEAAREAGILPG